LPESRHDFTLRGRIAPHHHHLRSYRSPQINNPPGRRAAYRPKPGISRVSQSRESPKIAAFARVILATGELAPIFGPSGRLLCNRNGENHHAIRPSSAYHTHDLRITQPKGEMPAPLAARQRLRSRRRIPPPDLIEIARAGHGPRRSFGAQHQSAAASATACSGSPRS
jgi:hypothetical protein